MKSLRYARAEFSRVPLQELTRQAWLELPGLFDQGCMVLSDALHASLEDVADCACTTLDVSDRAQLSAACRVLAQVAPALTQWLYRPEATASSAGEQRVMGLSVAVLDAWSQTDDLVGSAARFDEMDGEAAFEPAGTLPWLAWGRRLHRPDDEVLESAEDAAESVSDWFEDFLEKASEFRSLLLSGLALVHKVTPDLQAYEFAREVAQEFCAGPSGPEELLEEALDKATAVILSSLGYACSEVRDVQQLAASLAGEPTPVPAHAIALAQRIDVERLHVLSVRELREALEGVPASHMGSRWDQAPTTAKILAHAPEGVWLDVSVGGEAPPLPTPFKCAYTADPTHLPLLMRASGHGADTLGVVSLQRAVEMKAPQLAGWFELCWDE